MVVALMPAQHHVFQGAEIGHFHTLSLNSMKIMSKFRQYLWHLVCVACARLPSRCTAVQLRALAAPVQNQEMYLIR